MIYPKMYNNFSYIINKKTSFSIIIWLLFLIIGFIIFILISLKYEFYLCQTYLGYIRKIGNSFNTIIYVKEDEVNEISRSVILVDDKEYEFQIISISDKYFMVDNELAYEVILDIDLDNQYLIENNIVKLDLKKSKTTICQQIKKGIKKWKS